MEQTTEKPFFRKVLVIDDNATDRYIAKRMFEKYSFAEEIVLQESGPDALEYIISLENTPDLLPQFIFLDINMPEMNGYEFLEEYAKLPETVKTNCVIMMITTSIHPDDLKWAESNPFIIRFLNKPIDKEKMRIIKEEFTFKKQSG